VHLGVNDLAYEIRTIEVTDNPIGDVPMLPQSLARNPEDVLLRLVSADGAYDTRAHHEAVAHSHAIAIIPTRSNAKL
jgi:hypothetical protein